MEQRLLADKGIEKKTGRMNNINEKRNKHVIIMAIMSYDDEW